MNEVQVMDATGLVALESALASLRRHKCFAVLSGVQSQPLALLRKAHLDQFEGLAFCASTPEALALAAQHTSQVRGPTSLSQQRRPTH